MDPSPAKILQSPNDKRLYKSLTLPNKLQALLISDPDTDKCSASLCVNVGSILNHQNIQGLAHFLEHMLFLGTAKYPDESDYKDYMSKNAGNPNAYTSMTETVYFFECAKEALNGALDRFSQFFVSPLFTESCTEREMQAVHSEHQKNLLSDLWKKTQIIRSSAKSTHPYNTFATGNLETLKVENIREELLTFYEKYYSANLMKLVVYGVEPLENLEKWVIEMFSNVKNKDAELPVMKELPFDVENMGQFWKIVPSKDEDYLEIVWNIDYLCPLYRSNPGRYLSHLFGHEGENSLLSLLIDEGLALELSAWNSDEINAFSQINISIKLTKQGLANPLAILEYTFAYLKMLKEKGPQEYVFKEIKRMKELNFAFKEKENVQNYVVSLSTSLQKFPVEDILICHYLMENFEFERLEKTLASLRLDNMRVYLRSKEVADEANLEEPIYKTKYGFTKFTKEIEDMFNNPKISPKNSTKTLGLPVPNIFLPQTLEVNTKEATKYPYKLLETTQSLTYFKQDDTFKTPKGAINLRILHASQGFPLHCRHLIFSKIWKDLFFNYLRESLYLAGNYFLFLKINCSYFLEMAGIYTYIDCHTFGMDIKISGYSDSLQRWMKEIIENLMKFDPTKEERKFSSIHNQLKSRYENFDKDQPYQMTSYHTTLAMRKPGGFENEERVQVINKMSFQEFVNLAQEWLKNIRFECLAMGNLESAIIKELMPFIEEKFKNKGSLVLSKENNTQIRVIKLRKKSMYFYDYKIKEPKQNNSDVCIIFMAKVHPKAKIMNMLLENYLNSPYFAEIRTKQQVGYIVWSMYDEDRGVNYLSLTVQSNRYPSHYSAIKIMEFLDSMKDKILNIDNDEFQTYKNSIMNIIKEKDLNLKKEVDRHWFEMATHQYIFDRKEKEADILTGLTKEEFLAFVKNVIWEEPRILEIHSVCESHKEEDKKIKEERKVKNENLKEIETLKIFQSTMPLHPDYFSYFGGI